MIVGDDSGSRLYWALVDPGLAESADCSFHEYEGTGSFYTSFSGEPEEAESNLAIVLEVLRDAQRDGVTEEELQQARNKILSRVVRASERPKGRMIAVGMHWIYQHEYRTMDDELKAYEAVTTKTIREVLDRYPHRPRIDAGAGAADFAQSAQVEQDGNEVAPVGIEPTYSV